MNEVEKLASEIPDYTYLSAAQKTLLAEWVLIRESSLKEEIRRKDEAVKKKNEVLTNLRGMLLVYVNGTHRLSIDGASEWIKIIDDALYEQALSSTKEGV